MLKIIWGIKVECWIEKKIQIIYSTSQEYKEHQRVKQNFKECLKDSMIVSKEPARNVKLFIDCK